MTTPTATSTDSSSAGARRLQLPLTSRAARPFNATLTDAFAINSAGAIVGLYIDTAGNFHGYLAVRQRHDE